MSKPTALNSNAQAVLEEMGRALSQDAKPSDDAVWTGLYRAQLHEFRRFSGDAVAMRSVKERSVERGGVRNKLRVYEPVQVRNTAALLYFHGGGFIGGSLDTHDRLARSLAAACGSWLFALDYPLAPESPFPDAIEACYAAFGWLHEYAPAAQLDTNKLVVIGDSVGGLFAAAVAILCRDRGGAAPALQISLYPNMDLRADREYPSMHLYDGIVVKLSEFNRGLHHYLPHAAAAIDPRASPLACDRLTDLAPAWVLTCECDPLRDEGREWVSRLEQAGVAVKHVEAKGLPHAFLQMGGRVPDAQAMFAEIGRAIASLNA